MFRKIKRLTKKYPLFSLVAFGGLLSVVTSYLGFKGITGMLHVLLALVAFFPAAASANNVLRHGYFGMQLLPLVGILTALALREYSTAYLLGLLLSLERPLIAWSEYKNTPPTGTKRLTFISARHAPFIRLLDRLSVPYILLVLLIGGAIWVVTGRSERFLEVIAVASTAPLLLAAPILYLRGAMIAGKHGLRFLSASSFERLASIATLLVSKTGVLTDSNVRVGNVFAYAKHTKADVLRVAGSLAADSEHHLAKAIVLTANKSAKVHKAKHAHEVAGQGISGRMRGHNMYIGRLAFMKAKGMDLPAKQYAGNLPVVYVAEKDEIIGYITFEEVLLPGAKILSKRLQALDINVQAVSGSSEGSLGAVAALGGISEYSGDMDASQTIALLHSLQKQPVAFVGYSDTDGPILTAADVGIALDDKTPADVTVEDYEPSNLVTGLVVSRKTLTYARILSLASLFISLFLVVAATSGLFSPFQSAGLNIILTAMVVVQAASLRIRA